MENPFEEPFTPIFGPAIRSVLDAGHAVEKVLEKHTQPLQLTPALLLEAVACYPGMETRELAQWLRLEVQTVSGVVTRLVAQGLLEKHTVPEDQRLRRHYLTPAGIETLDALRESVAKVHGKLNAAILGPSLEQGELESMVGRVRALL